MRHATDKEGLYVNSVLTAVLLAIGNLIGMFDWFFQDTTRMAMLRDVVVVVIGVGVGVFGGLLLNGLWQSWQDASRRKQLLTTLKHTFTQNLKYLGQAVEQLNLAAINVPSFPMDLTTLESTSHVRAELIAGELAELIDRAFYELQHVDRRFEWLQNNCIDPYEGATYSQEEREQCERFLLRDSERYHQTCKIADFIKHRTRIELTARLVILLEAKISTLILISGQTNKTEPMRTGGALEHCQRAIDAIKKELAESPENENVADLSTGNVPIIKSIAALP